MFSDDPLILQLISLLKQFGICRVVISPGSRHYPIVHSLENDPFFTLYSVVDERSAAFFALGLIQKHGQPVAVSCTSGTSSLNYGSAVAEAFYQHLPLLLLTADRLPELLNQQEDQMYKQDDVFHSFIKYHGQLKQIRNPFDEWFCNRVINEGLLALSHHGRGPVQLNIPIEQHHKDKFSTREIPRVRRISRFYADEDSQWEETSRILSNSKILVVMGQSGAMSDGLASSLSRFLDSHDCVVLCDQLANFNHRKSFDNSYRLLRAIKYDELEELSPDVVLTLFANSVSNGEIKAFIRALGGDVEHWKIGRRGEVSDPFRRLTRIFEMREEFFFGKIAERGTSNSGAYAEAWRKVAAGVVEPDVPFSELSAIGELIRRLPPNSSLHVANSAPIRMAFAFDIADSVGVYCNRGVNGIDGCMSTAVGFAADAEEPVVLVIGDLTFFYDMNALWNRHLSKQLKILLLNNEGGAVMHIPFKDDDPKRNLPRHVSAQHYTSAKGWVESLGVGYFPASDIEECVEGVERLLAYGDGPAVLEVFTKKESDIKIFKQYLENLKPPAPPVPPGGQNKKARQFRKILRAIRNSFA